MTKWTREHVGLTVIFVVGGLLEAAVQAPTWAEVLPSLTPPVICGLGLQTVAFIRAIYTQRPRGSHYERIGD